MEFELVSHVDPTPKTKYIHLHILQNRSNVNKADAVAFHPLVAQKIRRTVEGPPDHLCS